MRFLCIYKPGTPDVDTTPTAEEIDKMGKLIDEMTKAGVLLATQGCMSSKHGFRMRIENGKFSVTDGPFPETKELISGFALIQVRDRAEAVEWTKRFLATTGHGLSEVRQIYEAPGHT
jgi:hypothetical protein